MKFEKRNFMGIELDVLTGHPEHDLLFVATQVARAAGLKNPANAISESRKTKAIGSKAVSLGGLIPEFGISVPDDQNGKKLRTTTTLMPESALYQILLRGHAPASEPFRKWVTEEVLPTIRKTGRYDAEQSAHPIAQGVIDELKMLRQDVADLKALLVNQRKQVVESPYVGTEATTVHYHFNDRLARELLESSGFDRIVADKLMPRVVLSMAEQIGKVWKQEDGRALDMETSTKQRQWTKFPKTWLLKQMDRAAYQRAIQAVLNAALK